MNAKATWRKGLGVLVLATLALAGCERRAADSTSGPGATGGGTGSTTTQMPAPVPPASAASQ